MASAYCTPDDLAAFASGAGVDAATDDAPDAGVAQAIERASSEIDFYCARYGEAALADNPWVRSCCLTLAAWHLYGRRLNPRPDSLAEDRKQVLEMLTRVLEGKARVPGAPSGKGGVPTVTNQRVDLARYPSVVTERPRSTGQAEGYAQRIDTGAEGLRRG